MKTQNIYQLIFLFLLLYLLPFSFPLSNNQHKPSLYSSNLNTNLISIPISSIIASSTLPSMQSNSFDASNILKNDHLSLWCSEKVDQSLMSLITIKLSRVYKVTSYNIEWAIAPALYSIEYSINNINWNNLFSSSFITTIKGGDNEFWNNVMNDESLRSKYKSFSNSDSLPSSISAMYIRIKMHKPINDYFAIYHLSFYTNAFDYIMIHSSNEHCLLNSGTFLSSNTCISSISEGYPNYIFMLDNSNDMIRTFNDNKCLLLDKNSDYVKIDECETENSWMIGIDKKIRNKNEMNKCLSIDDKDKEIDMNIIDTSIQCNSVYDYNTTANNAFNEDKSKIWMSSLTNDTKVSMKITLNSKVPISSIDITFTLPIKTFDIKLNDDILIYHYDNIDITKLHFNIPIDIIYKNKVKSIEIEMYESVNKKKGINQYAIERIKLISSNVFIKRKFCDEVDSVQIFEVEYVNNSIIDSLYNSNGDFTQQYYNQIDQFESNRKNFSFYKQYYMNIDKELDTMKTVQKNIIDNLHLIELVENEINKNIKEHYLNYTLLNTSSHIEYEESCQAIKEKNRAKRNGYYYIKTPCMPTPIKIYCDFSHDIDIHLIDRTKPISSIEDIRDQCSDLGLEPIEIKNIIDYNALISFIRKKEISNVSIPLGYEYSNKVYRSFTSSDSPSLTFITSNLTTSSINDIIKEDTIVYDTLLNRLSFKQLNSLSSSLLVCSTNNKFNIKTYIDLSCFSSLRDLSTIGNNIKVKCPSSCQYKDNNVYGSDVYYGDSSICLSAIHFGMSSLSIIEVHIIEGIEEYSDEYRNGIMSKMYRKQFNKEKAFRVSQYIPQCYNKDSSFIEIENEEMKAIDHIHYLQLKNILTYTKLSNKFSYLVEQSERIMKAIQVNNDTTSVSITSKYLSLLKGGLMIKATLDSVENILRNKVKTSNEELIEITKRYQMMKYYEKGFNETFNNGIKEHYDYDNNAKWYYNEGKEIVSINKGKGISVLQLRYIEADNFRMNVSFTLEQCETFSVIFHMIDQYNYYQLEVIHNSISINKVIGDIKSSLDIKSSNGIISFNKQYKIQITLIDSIIEVYIKNEMNGQYYKVLEAKDNQLNKGNFAFLTKGPCTVHIHEIAIEDQESINEHNEEMNNILSLSSCSNYYYEDYSFTSYDTNSEWIIKESIDNRDKVLMQNTKKNKANPFEEGYLYIDDHSNHFCVSNGKISIKFKSLSEGIIGIIFHFEDKDNFYITEISNEYIRIRRKVNGAYELIAFNNEYHYAINSWHYIVISISKLNIISVYFTMNNINNDITSVFSNPILLESKSTHYYIGLSTYNTAAFFDELTLRSNNKNDDDNDNNISELLYNNKCSKRVSFKERLSYCSINYKDSIAQCQSSYCEHCCNDNTNKQRNILYSCVKECNIANNDKDYMRCYDDKDIYDTQCTNEICKLDMCLLCCSSIYETSMTNKDRKDCYSGCHKTFK